MERIVITNFGGLNTKTPAEELPMNPVESPNIINAEMEEGTIYSRAPQNIHYNFGTIPINTIYVTKMKDNINQIVQVGGNLRRNIVVDVSRGWWNDQWGRKREIKITNTTYTTFRNLFLDLRLPGLDYTHFRPNGEDIRFVIYEDNYWKELEYQIIRWGKGVPATVLTQAVNDTATVIPANTAGYPKNGVIVIGNERIFYGSKDATSFRDCIRGYEETVAVSHVVNSPIFYEGCIYVLVPILEAQTSKIIEMYYGNPQAEPKNNVNLGEFDISVASRTAGKEQFVTVSKDTTYKKYDVIISAIRTGENCECLVPYIPSVDASKIAFQCEFLATNFTLYSFWAGFVFEKNNRVVDLAGVTVNRYATEATIALGRGKITKISLLGMERLYYIDVVISKKRREVIAKFTDYMGNVLWSDVGSFSDYDRVRYGYNWWGSWLGHGRLSSFIEVFKIDWVKVYNFLPEEVLVTVGSEMSLQQHWTGLFPVSTKPYQIVSFLDRTIFIVEDRNVISWDGVTVREIGGGKRAKFGLVHKNRLWLFNFPGLNEGSMVWYSKVNKIDTAEDWRHQGVDNIEFINKGDGFQITAIGIMSDNIVVFKENTAYLIYGDIPNIYIKQLNLDVGCIAWRSVANWENGLFFVSRKGIHFLRGGTAETPMLFTVDNIQSDTLTEKISPMFNNLNLDYLHNAIGVVWNDRYYVAVPVRGSERNDMILVVDYRRGWISCWIPPEPITSMFVDPFTNTFYIGTVNGNLRIQERKNLQLADEKLIEDGKRINSVYECGLWDFGDPSVRKRVRSIEVAFSGEVTVEYKVDGSQRFMLTLQNPTLRKRRIPTLGIGYFHQVNFYNFTRQIHSLEINFDYLRI